MSELKLGFVTSDEHCGSLSGLCFPTYPTEQGSVYQANNIQLWMYERWLHATDQWIDEIAAGDPWFLVNNGDGIEGRHHATQELIHHDTRIHTNLATDLLLPLSKRAAKTYIVRGTGCHARTSEDDIGKNIGSEVDPTTGSYCWEQLQLRVNGTLCHFKHHIGTTSTPWGAAGQLSVQLAKEQLVAARLGHEIPSVVVRSHRHEFDYFGCDGGLIVTTPAWQMLTRWARGATKQSFSVPGMIALDFRGKPEGARPTLHWTTYNPDPDPIMEL